MSQSKSNKRNYFYDNLPVELQKNIIDLIEKDFQKKITKIFKDIEKFRKKISNINDDYDLDYYYEELVDYFESIENQIKELPFQNTFTKIHTKLKEIDNHLDGDYFVSGRYNKEKVEDQIKVLVELLELQKKNINLKYKSTFGSINSKYKSIYGSRKTKRTKRTKRTRKKKSHNH